MLDMGLHVMVNSDDPAYFGGYLGENLYQCYEELKLSRDDLVKLCENSITACLNKEGKMIASGNILKMKSNLGDVVEYKLPIDDELLLMNQFLEKKIIFEFLERLIAFILEKKIKSHTDKAIVTSLS